MCLNNASFWYILQSASISLMAYKLYNRTHEFASYQLHLKYLFLHENMLWYIILQFESFSVFTVVQISFLFEVPIVMETFWFITVNLESFLNILKTKWIAAWT
jgi:hypothetical protein